MEYNIIHNCDFLENKLPDKCAHLIIADPPYFEVKGDFDFVWNSFDDYLEDVEKWAKECKRILADNGTLFWWGNSKKIAYSQIILDKYFNLENSLIWRKKDSMQYQYYSADLARSFNTHNERLLMYSNDSLYFNTGIYFIRDYIRSEILKSKNKISLNDINSILGVAVNGGGVASTCLSLDKSKPAMLTKEMYIKLQEWCYPYLNIDYDKIRRYFYNPLKFEEVLEFSQQSNISRQYNHKTQKAEELTRMLINVCSRGNDLVIVPFAGSGTECAMSVREGRKFIGYEIEPKYVDISTKRVKKELMQPKLF